MNSSTAHDLAKVFSEKYDMDDPRLAENWEQVVAEMHSQGCPVARSEVGEGYWVLNTYEDVTAVAQNWELFTSTAGYTPNRPEGQPMWYPVECDPPQHSSLRESLDPHFTPKVIAQHEEGVRSYASDLIDEFVDKGSADLVSDFSTPLPGYAFCGSLCHMPVDELGWLQERLAGGLTGPVEKRGDEFAEAYGYFDSFLKRRSEEEPRGDVIDAILDAEFEGYDWDMKVGTMAQVVTAGLMTTGHVLTCGAWYLSENRGDLERLSEEPKLWPRAVEEFTRAFAPSPHNGRKATKDTTIHGKEISVGDWVMLGYGAASRDPEVVENPETIDIARSPNRHVAFGAGIHRCIGAHLARLEIRVGLQVLFERIPDLKVKDGFEPDYEMSIVRSLTSLPIEFS